MVESRKRLFTAVSFTGVLFAMLIGSKNMEETLIVAIPSPMGIISSGSRIPFRPSQIRANPSSTSPVRTATTIGSEAAMTANP